MSRLPNPDLPFGSQDADTLLAIALWGEARGQSLLGVAAVACVILNRMEKQGKDVAGIVLAPKQFSSFNEDDPNRSKLLYPLRHDTAAVWERCSNVATLALAGFLKDRTNGATHYYADSMPSPPYWAHAEKGWIQTAKIGQHTFGTAP